MSAMRYSGELRIRVTYLEPWGAGTPAPAGRSTRPHGEYRCYISVGSVGVGSGGNSWIKRDGKKACGAKIIVGAPAVLSHAVDSPEAFDNAAATALSFAHDEGWPVESHAAYDAELTDWHIGRSPAKARPLEPSDSTRETLASPPPDGCLPPVLDPSEARRS